MTLAKQRPQQAQDASNTESKRREANLLTQLPYWHLEDGIVECRNRVFEVGFLLQLPDSDFMGFDAMQDLADTYLYIIRSCTPANERFRMVAEIVPAIDTPLEQYFDDITTDKPMLKALALSRYEAQKHVVAQGGVRQWRVYGSCTVSTHKKPGLEPFTLEEYPKILTEVKKVQERFIMGFASAGISAVPMSDDDVFAAIWRMLNPGLLRNHAPRYRKLPERELKALSRLAVREFPELTVETLRHQVCQSEIDNENPSFLRVGSKYVTTLAMKGLPESTIFGRINSVFSPTGTMWLVTDVHHPRQPKAQRSLMGQALYALGTAKGIGRADAEKKAAAVEEMTALERHIVTLSCTAIVIADSKEELQTVRTDIAAHFETMSGLMLGADTFEHAEHFFNALPFSGRAGTYKRSTFDITAKNFMPSVSPWAGSKRGTTIVSNRYGGLIPFTLLDERAANGHCLILGGSRTGKSYSAQALVMDELKRGDELIVLDRGNSWDELVRSAEGGLVEITPGRDAINPFELSADQLLPDPAQAQVMANIMESMLTNPTNEQLSFIPHAIAQTFEQSHYESGGTIIKNPVLLGDIVRRFEMMNRIGERDLGPKEREVALSLSRGFQSWIGDTPMGQFLDRPSTVDLSAKVLSFETKNIAQAGGLQRVGMMVLTNLIMRWLMRDVTQKKRVVFEELRAMTDTPQAITTLVTLYGTAAKYNTACTAINQGASLFNNPALQGIVDNTNIFVLFRLDRAEAQVIVDRVGLPANMVEIIAKLQSIKGFYSEALAIIRRADGGLEGGVVRFETSGLERWHYTSDKDDKGLRERAIEKFGGNRAAAMMALATDWRSI
jgi:conjugal transfer ATP-binding protein TraC